MKSNFDSEVLVADGALGVLEAAEFLGVKRTFLYSLMDRGELRYVKLGKRRLVPKAELRRLLASGLTAGRMSA